MTRSCGNDGDHSGAERKRLRPVLLDDVESRRSVENANQLVLGMRFPMACPGGLAKKQEPVTVTSQLRGAAFALRTRRLRCLPAEYREFCGFRAEIDDGRRLAFHVFPPSVDGYWHRSLTGGENRNATI